jgi:hypothetical protein
MSAIVGLMGEEELEAGLAVARTAGELWAVSDVVDLLEMPVLSRFLESRGELLQQVAVDVILRTASTQALSQVLAAASADVGELGGNEVAEGLARVAASVAIEQRSAELEETSADLAARGMVEMAAADAADKVAAGEDA